MPTLSDYSDSVIITYNYMKHDSCRNSSSARKTGKALKLNECDNIVVIDVDIKHDLPDDVKTNIRDAFMNALSNFNNIVIVQTGNGGLHIYTKRYDYECNNRNTKWFLSEKYDIDLFNSDKNKDKRSLIVLPPTKIRNDSKKIVSYNYIKGHENTDISDATKDVINALIDAKLIDLNECAEAKLLKLMDDIKEGKDKFADIHAVDDAACSGRGAD